ncbi:MAG TPA: hypothetical protein PKN57_11980 [Saprospiraceae bacterium]|nr:hypothetical protein [Saprospiraceae bacterium]HMV24176.1 hypothetical protein [Saprospiraceae bacterium]HMX82750.1 hypothetical protein [Saprospiraceae bacterium]HMZ74396.1 hypothetical protein [Saprospiraceae bacterium]HND16474.1 hypothetical protein [Saprospiraceae bacterium]
MNNTRKILLLCLLATMLTAGISCSISIGHYQHYTHHQGSTIQLHLTHTDTTTDTDAKH